MRNPQSDIICCQGREKFCENLEIFQKTMKLKRETWFVDEMSLQNRFTSQVQRSYCVFLIVWAEIAVLNSGQMSRLSENFHLAAVCVFCFLLILRNLQICNHLQSASGEDVICAKDEIEHLNYCACFHMADKTVCNFRILNCLTGQFDFFQISDFPLHNSRELCTPLHTPT